MLSLIMYNSLSQQYRSDNLIIYFNYDYYILLKWLISLPLFIFTFILFTCFKKV